MVPSDSSLQVLKREHRTNQQPTIRAFSVTISAILLIKSCYVSSGVGGPFSDIRVSAAVSAGGTYFTVFQVTGERLHRGQTLIETISYSMAHKRR
jgi:hypothetical protein